MTGSTTPDDVLAVLEEIVVDGPPVATAPEIAEELPVTRRTVLNRLEALDGAGRVESRHVGNHRVWWPASFSFSEVPREEPRADPPEEPPAERDPSGGFPREEPPAEPPAEPRAEDPDVVDAGEHVDVIDAIVERASREWRGERVEQRRRAARKALRWLRRDGGPASAGTFRDQLLPDAGVDGQNERTWWKKTVRPAVQEAVDDGLAEYREGHHDYRWIATADAES